MALGLQSQIIFFKICDEVDRPNTRFYNNSNGFYIPNINTVHYGEDSLRYFGPKIWNIIPAEIKQKASNASFKAAIKSWFPPICPCRLCRNYIGGVGYINNNV